MLQLKSLSLKLLYFITGFPVLLMFWLIADKMKASSLHLIWWGLIGIIVVTRILLQKEKYETGTITTSWKTTILTLAAAGVFCYFFYLKFI